MHLAPGEKALCTRCDAVLAKGERFGCDAALVFSITGLILSLPAFLLPFISAGKLGDQRISLLFTGVEGLWDNGMRLLAVLVFLCGGLVPVVLLGIFALLHVPARSGGWSVVSPLLSRTAHILEHWSIPEVQVLAVLVALMKLGSLVDVAIGPGFWCYCAMALALMLAQHSFDFDAVAPISSPGRPDAATQP